MELKSPPNDERIEIICATAQLVPPIGSEVSLVRPDNSRLPARLLSIHDIGGGSLKLVFERVIEQDQTRK